MKISGKWIVLLALAALGLFLLFGAILKSNKGTNRGSLKLGRTESRNSLTSGTTSSSSDNHAFNARHVLFLINGNPHPLSHQVESLVAQGLKDFPQIENVQFAWLAHCRRPMLLIFLFALICARSRREPGKGKYFWSMIQAEKNYGRTSMWSEFILSAKGDWQQTFNFEKRSIKVVATPLPNGNGFRYHIDTKLNNETASIPQ